MKVTFCLAATVLVCCAAPILAGVPEATTNLLYTPVKPCRIIDTRVVGGSFNNATRAYKAKGTSYTAQGGVATTCNIPTAATAIFVNLLAVNGTRPGFLTAYAWDSSGPIAANAITFSLVNYSNIANLNLANGVAVPICNIATATGGTCTNDFFIFNEGSEVIADVVGYFSPRINTSNNITSPSATIGGGESNTATVQYSTVGGGFSNDATADYSTVGGGGFNAATVQYSTVGGGILNNAAGDSSTVGGGATNNATGDSSTVGGGTNNKTTGISSTVGGGFTNDATADYSTIGGGDNNDAVAPYSTVGGGSFNAANGPYSTVVGGAFNSANGSYSFAGGRQAKATLFGTFVWGDATAADVTSFASNSFTVRAVGGTRFYTNTALSTGVSLAAGGGSWSNLSDRAVKRNIQAINGANLLKKLATIPIAKWNYVSQDTKIRHIGPMAQDFYKAFGVGEDDKHISTVDAQGVALAAIQALYQQMQVRDKQQQQRINKLEQELIQLKKSMQRMTKP